MPRSCPTFGATWLVFALVPLINAEPVNTGLESVWAYAAGNQPLEARAALGRGEGEGIDARSRTLAEAVLAMARPPLSDGDWRRIEPMLAGLAKGDDDIAAQALYLQARMYQVQKTVPDYARAEELLAELERRWPKSHWTQLGLVKLGLVKLLAENEPADPRARIAAVTALLPRLTEPALRRDLQLQIGWAALFYELPLGEVLPHLIAADEIGGLMGITPEDLVIQIGELSFRAGQLEQSQRYFKRALAEFPTSTRLYNVQQRLHEVQAKLAARGDGA